MQQGSAVLGFLLPTAAAARRHRSCSGLTAHALLHGAQRGQEGLPGGAARP